MKKVAILHTSFVSVDDLRVLFTEIAPEAGLVNIVDDSLLPEVMANGGVTPAVVRRLCMYAVQAESLGVDLLFNQCSSVGEAFDVAARLVSVPALKVDRPMAEAAVACGNKIAVIATVPTTLGPSCRLVEAAARDAGRAVEINRCLVEGAFEALTRESDKGKHNRLVLEAVRKQAETADAVVLAQGSMIALLPMLGDVGVPVLTSPRLGVERARHMLGL